MTTEMRMIKQFFLAQVLVLNKKTGQIQFRRSSAVPGLLKDPKKVIFLKRSVFLQAERVVSKYRKKTKEEREFIGLLDSELLALAAEKKASLLVANIEI